MKIGNRPLDQAYAESIKPVRNRMRAYQYDCILDALLRHLNSPLSKSKVEYLQSLPWVAERLILWLLSDNPAQYKSQLIDDNALKQLIQMAWNSANSLYKNDIKIMSLKLYMRQLLLPQAPYQVSLDTHAFALQLYFISKLEPNSRLRKYLDERAGMSIEQYFQIALLFWTHTNTEKPWFNGDYIRQLMPLFSENNLNTFLNSIAFSKQKLQKLLHERVIELDEWFQPTVFYRTPCILHENAIIPFGRPTLRRYFENLIGDWLEDENGQCLRDYDELVSKYVQSGLERCKANFLGENQIKEATNTTKRVCDFLIDEVDCYVLLEVKNKSLTKKIPTSSNPIPLKSRLNSTIVSAKEQLDDTREACSQLPQYKNRICYRVIVTKADLWLGDIQSVLVDYDEPLPIWIMSLADLDNLVELVAQKKTTFCGFFQDLTERQKTAEFSVFSAGMLFEKAPYKLDGLPKHLTSETDKIFDVLKKKIIN